MSDLPAGYAIEEASDDFGPFFVLRRAGDWMDEDYDRERIVAFAHHLARPVVTKQVTLEVLCHAEDELDQAGRRNGPACRKVRQLIDAMMDRRTPPAPSLPLDVDRQEGDARP